MHDKRSEYDVFVNCPFDDAYKPLFEAIVFAVHDCGYVARCSLEVTDASEVRIEKIRTIIASCRFGIHDISRTELAIKAVRIWLNDATPRSTMIPSGDEVAQRYVAFRNELPTACDRLQLRIADLTFNDYVLQVQEWLKLNPRGRVSLDRAAGTHVRFRGTKDHWPGYSSSLVRHRQRRND